MFPSSMENFKDSLISSKKLGIVCNDAGGAEIISSWLKRVKNKFYLSLSGPALVIFRRKFRNIKLDNLKNVISKSDLIVTGTSLKSNKELEAIKISRKYKKKTITFLDHWVNYRRRFVRNNIIVQPNYLIVSDKEAFRIAKDEFKNSITIFIKKNFYLLDLKKKISKINSKIKKNNFVYFSSNLDSTSYPYSDNFILKKGVEFMKKNNKLRDFNILIRKHPSENRNKYKNLKIEGIKIFIDKHKELNNTIDENNYFFGFESMALVVASICGKKTYSFKSKIKKLNVVPRKYINHYIKI